MTNALIFVALLLILGVVLRQVFPVFRWLFIPASVVAGVMGLAMIQTGLQLNNPIVADWANSTSNILSSWPGWLIAVVFFFMLM